jgi:hypothetical protein
MFIRNVNFWGLQTRCYGIEAMEQHIFLQHKNCFIEGSSEKVDEELNFL